MSDNTLSSDILDIAVLWPAASPHPLPPTGITANYTVDPRNSNKRAVKLTWTAPADSPDLAFYKIWRNDEIIATVPATQTEYLDESPSGDVDYASYYLVSEDIFGVSSGLSDIITNISLRANTLVDTLRMSLKDNPADPRSRRWTIPIRSCRAR